MPQSTVKVDRSTKWGNPYKIGQYFPTLGDPVKCKDAAHAVRMFRLYVAVIGLDMTRLRGKNLACWCKPGDPCHADVLLEIANK